MSAPVAETRHFAPCEQHAQHGRDHVRASVQREPGIGAVEHGARQHLGQRHVADHVGRDRDDQRRHGGPPKGAHDFRCLCRLGAIVALLGGQQQPEQQRCRECCNAEHVQPVQQGLAQQQHAEAIQQVQDSAEDRPSAEHLIDPLRQQPQHGHHCEHQRHLVQHERCVGEEERYADRDQQQPCREGPTQHLGGGLHGRLGHDRLAAPPCQPEQHRQQQQGADPIRLDARLVGLAPFFEEGSLQAQPGRGALQFRRGETRVLNRFPGGRRIDRAETSIVIGDRRIDAFLAGIDAGLHGVGSPAQLELFVQRLRQRFLGLVELLDDHADAIDQGRRHSACANGRECRFPHHASLGEFGRVLGVTAGAVVEFRAPLVEFALVKAPVVLQAPEPDRRELLQVVVLERLGQLRNASGELAELRAELGAGIPAFGLTHHVLRKALVGVRTQRDVAGRDRFRRCWLGRRFSRRIRGLGRAGQQSDLGADRRCREGKQQGECGRHETCRGQGQERLASHL